MPEAVCRASELASNGGSGMHVDLERVLLRDPTLTAGEILMSESRHRCGGHRPSGALAKARQVGCRCLGVDLGGDSHDSAQPAADHGGRVAGSSRQVGAVLRLRAAGCDGLIIVRSRVRVPLPLRQQGVSVGRSVGAPLPAVDR